MRNAPNSWAVSAAGVVTTMATTGCFGSAGTKTMYVLVGWGTSSGGVDYWKIMSTVNPIAGTWPTSPAGTREEEKK